MQSWHIHSKSYFVNENKRQKKLVGHPVKLRVKHLASYVVAR